MISLQTFAFCRLNILSCSKYFTEMPYATLSINIFKFNSIFFLDVIKNTNYMDNYSLKQKKNNITEYCTPKQIIISHLIFFICKFKINKFIKLGLNANDLKSFRDTENCFQISCNIL